VRGDASFECRASRGGRYELCWRSTSGAVPRNQNFEIEAWLFEDGRPAPGTQLFVRGWMPDHGHGMLHAPTVVDMGDGSYRVKGMLLHMRGHWQLSFDVLQEGQADVIETELGL
jgi:hypothetical protein